RPYTGGLGPTVPDDRVCGEVDLAPADGEAGALRRPVITAERGPQPREQFLHIERLGDVVVCARVKGADLVLGAGPPREDNDRRPGPRAQGADHLGPLP